MLIRVLFRLAKGHSPPLRHPWRKRCLLTSREHIARRLLDRTPACDAIEGLKNKDKMAEGVLSKGSRFLTTDQEWWLSKVSVACDGNESSL
jgi:hypothetical protein